FSSRRRHTRSKRDWSSDVCSSDLSATMTGAGNAITTFKNARISVALMLNELRTQMLKKFIQTAIYVPHFLSWAIVSGLTYLLFEIGRASCRDREENIEGERSEERK